MENNIKFITKFDIDNKLMVYENRDKELVNKIVNSNSIHNIINQYNKFNDYHLVVNPNITYNAYLHFHENFGVLQHSNGLIVENLFEHKIGAYTNVGLRFNSVLDDETGHYSFTMFKELFSIDCKLDVNGHYLNDDSLFDLNMCASYKSLDELFIIYCSEYMKQLGERIVGDVFYTYGNIYYNENTIFINESELPFERLHKIRIIQRIFMPLKNIDDNNNDIKLTRSEFLTSIEKNVVENYNRIQTNKKKMWKLKQLI